MKYVLVDDRGTDIFTEEFNDRETAIKTAKLDWSRMSDYDKKNCYSFQVIESVNPDEEAVDHLDGDPIWDAAAHGNWYAVQETTEDAWDDGSYDWDEAVALANERGYDIIAEIDESGTDNFCVAEYHRGTDF